MKKILGIASIALLISAGGGYFYCAQQFETNAQNIVSTIEKAKPALDFDSIQIDKYRFEVRFKGLKLDTKTIKEQLEALQKIMEQTGAKKNEFQFTGEPILITTSNTLVLAYNPFTKTISLSDADKDSSTKFVQGSLTKEIKSDSAGSSSLKLKVNKHPVLNTTEDLVNFVKTITDVSYSSPKVTWIDTQSNQPLLSLDYAKYDLSVHLPENDQEDAILKFSYDDKNKVIEKEFYQTIYQFVWNAMAAPGTPERNIVDSLSKNMPYRTSKSSGSGNAEFKIKMAALNKMKEKDYDIKKDFPAVSGHFKCQNTSNSGDYKIDFDIDKNNTTKLFKVKLDLEGNCDSEVRPYYASFLKAYIKSIMDAMRAELKDVDTNSPVLQFDLSDEAALDITPDLASLGKMTLSLNMDGNLETLESKGNLALGNDQYNVTIKGNYGMTTGGKIEASVTNHEQILNELKAYINRLFSHKEIKALDTTGAHESIIQNMMIGQMTLEAMGKKEEKDGKTVLKIELPLPAAGGTAPTVS